MDNFKYDTSSLLDEITYNIRIQIISNQANIKKFDWMTYNQKRAYQIKTMIKRMMPIITKAVNQVSSSSTYARKKGTILNLNQKVTILLIQKLLGKSNRNMAYMLIVFSLINGPYISYKTIERFYSDNQVYEALLKLKELIFYKPCT